MNTLDTASQRMLAPLHALIRAGRRAEAEAQCAAIVAEHADAGEVWLLLGSLRLDRGQAALAVADLERAHALRPLDPVAGLRHAVAKFRAGDPAQARVLLARLVDTHPDDAAIVFHEALLAEQVGEVESAASGYARTLELDAGHREAAMRFGLIELRQGRAASARRHLENAWSSTTPQLAEPLARACLELGDLGKAHEYATRLAQHAPARMDGWLLQGIALRRANRALDAKAPLAEAYARAPDDPRVLVECGCNLRDVGDFQAGQALLARAYALAPEWKKVRWLHDLGIPVLPANDDEARVAVDSFVRRIDQLVGDLDAGVDDLRDSALAAFSGITPFALHYLPCPVQAATWRFADLAASVVDHGFAAELRAGVDWQALAHAGRIRVGIVSAEVRVHTITRYFAPWLEALDAQRFEVHVWHIGNVRDALTERVAERVHAFQHRPHDTLEDLVTSIRAARLDVLVYLEVGMDGRQGILGSMRLAPVQCAAYGHPVTTGLRGIDVFLSSDAAEPPDAQAHYRERLERLPGLGVAFTPPPAPGNGDWLPREPGRPLLLCLQSLFKLAPEFDELIVRIAAQTDAKIGFFDSPPALGPRFLSRIGARFAEHGLDAQRHLVMLDRHSLEEYLGGIAEADLVLDSTVFSGGATSLDALSVGTPIVTLEGEFMRGRQTAAMLRMLDAGALVASSHDDYVRIAVELCRNEASRRHWREHLLARAPSLFDRADALPALETCLARLAHEASARPGHD